MDQNECYILWLVPYREQENLGACRHTEGRNQWDYGGGDWSDDAMSQGTPRMTCTKSTDDGRITDEIGNTRL